MLTNDTPALRNMTFKMSFAFFILYKGRQIFPSIYLYIKYKHIKYQAPAWYSCLENVSPKLCMYVKYRIYSSFKGDLQGLIFLTVSQ
jgi:hypothetical protein